MHFNVFVGCSFRAWLKSLLSSNPANGNKTRQKQRGTDNATNAGRLHGYFVSCIEAAGRAPSYTRYTVSGNSGLGIYPVEITISRPEKPA